MMDIMDTIISIATFPTLNIRRITAKSFVMSIVNADMVSARPITTSSMTTTMDTWISIHFVQSLMVKESTATGTITFALQRTTTKGNAPLKCMASAATLATLTTGILMILVTTLTGKCMCTFHTLPYVLSTLFMASCGMPYPKRFSPSLFCLVVESQFSTPPIALILEHIPMATHVPIWWIHCVIFIWATGIPTMITTIWIGK